MAKRERKKHGAEQKAAILREHLIDRTAVSDLCDRHGIHPTQLYRWQKTLFENLGSLFDRGGGSEATRLRERNDALREKLARKDMIIAQIMEDFIEAKKKLGAD